MFGASSELASVMEFGFKGMQPVPKIVCRRDCRDKHNYRRCGSNLGPPHTAVIRNLHVTTRPLRPHSNWIYFTDSHNFIPNILRHTSFHLYFTDAVAGKNTIKSTHQKRKTKSLNHYASFNNFIHGRPGATQTGVSSSTKLVHRCSHICFKHPDCT